MSAVARRRALGIFAAMAGTSLMGALAIPVQPEGATSVIDLEASIPREFGPWQLDRLAAALVRPSDELSLRLYQHLLERTYVDAMGRRVMLSIAYGAQQAAGLELHLPEVCYRYAGFAVGGRHIVELDVNEQRIAATRLVAELPQRPEVVTYWIVLGGESIADGNSFRLRRLANAVRRRSADGLLVRVSSLDPNAERAHALQMKFLSDMWLLMSKADRELLVGRRTHATTLPLE